SQSLIYAFDNNTANRAVQDVGLDGLTDANEADAFPTAFAGLPDPANDNDSYCLAEQGPVLDLYKKYNGLEKNSPVDVTDNNRGNATIPDVEDINRDNTMNTINAYYQYNIDLGPNPIVGQNYVTDIKTSSA